MVVAENTFLPPLLCLPTEIQLIIVVFVSATIRPCSLCYDRHLHIYNASSKHQIPVLDPAILSLRCTNVHFSLMIPLTQNLLLGIERFLHQSSVAPLACCACLRLRARYKFPTQDEYPRPSRHISAPSREYLVRSATPWVKDCYRFCVDCGFSAYPNPHSHLRPRRERRNLGVALPEMTAYAPGTKIKFHTYALSTSAYHVWVWCMDCRLLKVGVEAGSLQCRLFCKQCCVRLGCESQSSGDVKHTGYRGIQDEIKAEGERRRTRLEAGAIYVGRGSSFLLRNKVQGRRLEQEEEDQTDSHEEAEWKHWFGNSESRSFLPQPVLSTKELSIGTSGNRTLYM